MDLLTPTPIILGIIFILVAAYIADLLEKIRKYKGKSSGLEQALQDALAMADILSEELKDATPRRGPYEREVKTWKEYKDENAVLKAQLTEFELTKRVNVFRDRLEGPVLKPINRPDSVIKVEMSEDFKELKKAIDQLGAVAILKKELDRAHKRETVYLTRIAANTGLIEKKISDVTKK